MPEPTYFVENRYSYVFDARALLATAHFEVASPESAFERSVQAELVAAHRLLMERKHGAALTKYQQIRGLIAATIVPRLPPWIGTTLEWTKVNRAELLDPLIARSAEMLVKTPVSEAAFPPRLLGGDIQVSDAALRPFAGVAQMGLTDRDLAVGSLLDQAGVAVGAREFDGALALLQRAAETTRDRALAGAIIHDVGVLLERSGDRPRAVETLNQSARMFAGLEQPEAQVDVLTTLAGTLNRGGSTDAAAQVLKEVDGLRAEHNLFDIAVSARAGARDDRSATAVRLLSTDAFATRRSPKQFAMVDVAGSVHAVVLDRQAARNVGAFYDTLSTTNDVSLLMGYLVNHTTTVAYLTHVCFWVLPMAIGDCQAALGSYAEAEKEYLSTLDYKYLNRAVESVNLWLRLAELYLDWGDRIYRQARNVVADFAPARDRYELVMLLDNTLDGASPLYASPLFGTMRARVEAAVGAMFLGGAPVTENPRVTSILARARVQLTKIDSGLNYLGMSLTLPPFSFEHLQVTARYFAQHAAQVESTFIQFQSSAENEQLREQQMAQQAAIAAASVELERRGVAEAQEGLDVARANLNLADVQRQNAQQAANDFAAVRWELYELDTLQAWSSAAAQDEDDEVEQTIRGFTYYSANDKRRSEVLYELSARRTRISHDLEAARLQREIAASNAYRATAQQQVQQAQARIAVAQQRVVIAQAQEQFAKENLEFLQGREFSSAVWYNLARESRRIANRYLDMAIEVAVMMEKAYEAETGRDLRKIKLEYGLGELNGLLGADALLMDVDYFTLDHVRTRSKKAQMRQGLSLGDLFPMAFRRLLAIGTTYFETTLDHFDRRYPGFYLQKVKQVEVVFVGLNGSEGLHGTLRNIGLSQFRQKDGTIVHQTYPADIMPLSEYDVRQDAVIFQLDARELRLFENNGVATMWQLDLPRSSNTFDLNQILDIQMVLYYDGFFDPGLEATIKAALPAGESAARAFSLRMFAPDELYFLRSQGSARLKIDATMLPANHGDPRITDYFVQAVGPAAAGLKVRLESDALGAGHLFTLDASGNASGAGFPDAVGQPLVDSWTISVPPAENPGVDVGALTDFSLFVEYDFTYPA
ncbi:hypothetical protein PHK61_26775 [Actinomycetospora lutea]|uniref:Tc toxin subunit A-related protein n=1 Tax=Actinomycetospora lutea TaxID=663604 RepID=UPI00236614DB|nr:hypothetical protein [Actinomycetospora lutea]MDD7942026.1 hypothetical protein [Actinomycetospora lutea]